MKKNILAVAIAGAMAVPFAANASAPTLYGQMNIAVDSVTDNGSAVVNRNSRLGVKGSEDLGNGLKAVYQFETTLNANGGGEGFGSQRNTFVGVAGGFGTVIAGRHDTPLRMIQPNDRFNDSAYLGNNTGTFGGLIGGGKGFSGEDRLDNMVAYLSPNINGFQVVFGGVTTAKDSTDKTIPKDQNLGNAYSASVAYGSKRNGLYAAVGLTQRTDKLATSDPASVEQQNTRAVVQYSDSGLVVSGMFNGVTAKGTGTDNAYTLGAAYTMGDFTPRAKVAIVDYAKNSTVGGTKDATNFALGLDYALGKKTRTFVEYGVIDKNSVTGVSDTKSTDVFTVGLAHSF